MGAVNFKSKLVQAMVWHREDTKPLPESVVIQANGAYMSLSDWLSWLLHSIWKIYPCGEKRYCNLFLWVQLILNQNWFRQWLGTEKTLSHYLNQWWSRPMVHIWVSPIDWVDYFIVFGKYIHAEKNGTVWTHEGYLHPHSWKWAIPTPQVGSGRGTGWPYFVKSPLTLWERNLPLPTLSP